jgi:hypothetical protein
MRMLKGVAGWIMAFGLFAAVKIGIACSPSQQQVIKDKVVQCVAPATADVAAAYSQCKAQGGDDKWCMVHAALLNLHYVECLWQEHAAGKCDSSTCPFHQGTADGGVSL